MMGRCGDAAADYDRAQQGGLQDDGVVSTGLAEASRCHHSIGEAERLMGEGQWAAARDHLDVAVGLTEAAPDLLLRRAKCQFQLGDFYGAAADTGRAIKVRSCLCCDARGVGFDRWLSGSMRTGRPDSSF